MFSSRNPNSYLTYAFSFVTSETGNHAEYADRMLWFALGCEMFFPKAQE